MAYLFNLKLLPWLGSVYTSQIVFVEWGKVIISFTVCVYSFVLKQINKDPQKPECPVNQEPLLSLTNNYSLE